eukprot:g164.t1
MIRQKVTISCPSETQGVFELRYPNTTIANVVIRNCNLQSGSPISVAPCADSTVSGTHRLLYMGFLNNSSPSSASIVFWSPTACSSLELENANIRKNSCGKEGCFMIPSVATLTTVKIYSNKQITEGLESGFVFVARDSTISVFFVESYNNRCGSFFFFRSSVFLRTADFGNNSRNELYGQPNGIVRVIESQLRFDDCEFLRNTGQQGGAILSQSSTLNFTLTPFTENKAILGGGIYADNTTLFMQLSDFEGNEAEDSGGGIFIQNSPEIHFDQCTFLRNKCSHHGGGIRSRISNLKFERTKFLRNEARVGGAMSMSLSILNVSASTFSQNLANSFGGSIYLSRCENTSIWNSTFYGDLADEGGSIMAEHSTLNGSLLSFNQTRSGTRGSAISLYNSFFQLLRSGIYESTLGSYVALSARKCNVLIQGVDFARNQATCLALSYSNATISNCKFISNKAEYGGMQSVADRAILRNSTFIDNDGGRVGQVYLMTSSNTTILDSEFLRNSASDGGAITTSRATLEIKRTRFISNRSTRVDGGAISCVESSCSAEDTLFQNNTAELDGGGFRIYDKGSAVLRNCRFINNTATLNGGGVYGLKTLQIVIENVEFYDNYATLKGGGAFFEHSKVSINGSHFLTNSGMEGGCVQIVNSSLSISQSKLEDCRVNNNGGGIHAQDRSNITTSYCVFKGNNATEGGAVFLISSNLNGSGSTFESNEAKNGGALYVNAGCTLFFTNFTFKQNIAEGNGGAINLKADDTTEIACQMLDSIFEENKARFGGAFHLERRERESKNCTSLNRLCSGVAILGTTFIKNEARDSGPAIQTNNVSSIRVDCKHSKFIEFLSMSDLLQLPAVDNRRNCYSWKGNQVTSSVGTLGTVGSYARRVNISFILDSMRDHDQWIDGHTIKNVKSGEFLPTIYVTAVDEFGNGPAFVSGGIPDAELYSPDGFFPGKIPMRLPNGTGRFEDIVGFKVPRIYHLSIRFTNGDIEEMKFSVEIRECEIGEEPSTDSILCEACDLLSFNFEPKNGRCTTCPKHGDCSGRFIIPDSGYWHSSPCSHYLRRCLTEEACEFDDRKNKLRNATKSLKTCVLHQTVANKYAEEQCKPGYTGMLCGACEELYGRYGLFNCGKCLHLSLSLLFIILAVLWLLLLASTVIKGSLPHDSLKSRRRKISGSIQRLVKKTGRSSPPTDNISVEMVSRGSIPSTVAKTINHRGSNSDTIRLNAQELEMMSSRGSSSSIATSSSQHISQIGTGLNANDGETSKIFATESFKITMNYLQVIAIAATINVVWTDAISKLLVIAENLGGLTSETITGSVDCLATSLSPETKSLLRVIVSMLAPLIVCLIFALFWTFYTIYIKEKFLYFLKRIVLSSIVVLYISYLGLTKLAVKVFYCVDVHDLNEYEFLDSVTKYWAMDTNIKCYNGHHIFLTVLGILCGLLITVLFPLFSTFVSVQSVKSGSTRMRSKWIFDIMGFMYIAFDDKFIFWESVILSRKALCSIIAVFSYPLGGDVQSILASIVLVLALFLHMTCRPYKKEFSALNTYEAVSLLVSAITFNTSQFFEPHRCGRIIRIILSICLLLMNVGFLLFMSFVSLRYGIRHLQSTLEDEGITIPERAGSWTIVKTCVAARFTQWKEAYLLKK